MSSTPQTSRRFKRFWRKPARSNWFERCELLHVGNDDRRSFAPAQTRSRLFRGHRLAFHRREPRATHTRVGHRPDLRVWSDRREAGRPSTFDWRWRSRGTRGHSRLYSGNLSLLAARWTRG